MMNKIEFMVGPQDGSQVVETVSFGNVVGQAGGVGMSMVGVDFNIKVVCENLLATARC